MTKHRQSPSLARVRRHCSAGGAIALVLSAAVAAQTDCPMLPAIAKVTQSPTVPTALVHAVGDMDGDGDNDVVVGFGSTSSNMVIVYFNDGAASFMPGPPYAVPPQPRSLWLADIDGQGGLDVVTANRESGSITILLNPGDGTLESAGSTFCGPQPGALAVGDVDGDADLDFVVANHVAAGTLSVLRNEGDGLAALATIIPVGNRPSAVGIGRLNPDALPDLVVGYRTPDNNNALLAASFNDGGGTFGPVVGEAATFGLPGAVVVSDLTGDGSDEILMTTQYGSIRLLNDGFGGFKTASFGAQATMQRAVVLHDVNSDSFLDLLTTEYAGGSPYAINLRLGQPGAMFDSPTLIWCDTEPQSLCVADMDGDGHDDLLVGQPGLFTILRSDGVRSFEGEVMVGTLNSVSQFQSVDIDNDGDRDLLGGHDGLPPQITVIKNNAGFDFSAFSTYAFNSGQHLSDMVTADIDGDGDKDVIVKDNNNDMLTLRNDSTGAFSSPAYNYAGGQGGQIAAADFDHDGDIDVIAPNTGFNQSEPTNTVNLVTNNGAGVFTFAYEIACGQAPIAVAGTDVDDDRDVDLIVATTAWQSLNPAVSVLKNNGAGVFTDFMSVPLSGRPGRLTLGDIDRDGDEDVVVCVPATPTGGLINIVAVLKVQEDGSLSPPQYYDAARPRFPVIQDLNGDGWPEVVCASDGSGVRVLVNRGDGTFEIAHHSSIEEPNAVAVDDFDSDGYPDVLLTHENTLGLLSNQGAIADIAQQPADSSVARGQSASFHVEVRPPAGLDFQWFKDNSPLNDGGHISGSATSMLSISQASVGDEGAYRVVISNGHCSISSDEAHLSISSCVGDIAPAGGDGSVDVDDMVAVIVNWGPCPQPCPPACIADVAPSCRVDVDDLLAVILAWGSCP